MRMACRLPVRGTMLVASDQHAGAPAFPGWDAGLITATSVQEHNMTIGYWCVVIAAFLPILFTGVAKFSGPGFNNRRPRDFLSGLTGFRQRAYWAHLNSFEAFPPFAAAVIIAHQIGLNQTTLDYLAIGFIVARLAYGIFYLLDRASLRSLAWVTAVGCWVAMLVMAP
jgi:uncharacterized MAPEG superfamily protein